MFLLLNSCLIVYYLQLLVWMYYFLEYYGEFNETQRLSFFETLQCNELVISIKKGYEWGLT